MNNIYIYGDSIMKATIPDENMKYHFHINEYIERFFKLPVNIVNKAKFGAHIDKGFSIIEKDLAKSVECDIALVEYGGNDCNFDWNAIAESPEAQHDPKTILDKFVATLTEIVVRLRAAGVRPVLMTLPPIDSQKYFNFITRDGKNGENILRWLGDIEVISRYQEMYSNAVSELASKLQVFCIDIREYLMRYNLCEIISEDGIHPSANGYKLIFDKLYDVLIQHI